MLSHEEIRLKFFLEWRPVAANHAIVGNDRLENAAVVVRLVTVVGREDDVAALVADEVFVVRRNQKVFAFAETTGAAIIRKIKFPEWQRCGAPHFYMEIIAQDFDSPPAIVDVQPRPPHKILNVAGCRLWKYFRVSIANASSRSILLRFFTLSAARA